MKRTQFLKMMALLPLLKDAKGMATLLERPDVFAESEKMPVFFVGHQDLSKDSHITPFTQNLRSMGASVKPSSILVISAHWLTLGDAYVNMNTKFTTREYPSTGSPETAKMVMGHATGVKEDAYRELDHGAWSVLRHIAPKADIPVLELSIDMAKPLDYHWNLARQLRPLRNKGVLIIGSGNIVHNLQLSALKFYSKKPFHWAVEFDEWAKGRIDERDFTSLFNYFKLGKLADLAVPTMDHYLPLLYCLSLCDVNERITYTHEEVTSGVSFRCLRID
jgi:4,5-DOPA dioxygenase extradiol